MPKPDPHSIEHEPHLRPITVNSLKASTGLGHVVQSETDLDSAADQSVWDEPSLQFQLSGPPPKDAMMFRNWFKLRSSQWTESQSWMLTLSIAIAAGPASLFAVVLMLPNVGWLTPLVECFFSPLAQELAKIALPLWVVERRPYYFKYGLQIAMCTIGSGVVFGLLAAGIAWITWSGFPIAVQISIAVGYLLMHLLCSSISTLGLYHIWRRPVDYCQPARLTDGALSFIMAFIIHALFTSLVLIANAAIVVWQTDSI